MHFSRLDRRAVLAGLAGLATLGSAAPARAQATASPEGGADPGAIAGEEVMLPQRLVLAYDGRTAWDDAEQALAASFARLRTVATGLGAQISGPMIADYTDETETDFAFRAMAPIAAAPAGTPPADVRMVALPGGAAVRFRHTGGFAELEVTYERIDDYLVARGLETTRSLEEYRKEPDGQGGAIEVDILIFR